MKTTSNQQDSRAGKTLPAWVPLAGLAILILIFWWPPLMSDESTLHWDAIDYHLGAQGYFAEELKAGRLPVWTDYQYSGFPFLADPQVGAWYPLNWPFFLVGVSEKTLVAELFLHALLAAFGAYLLARLWLTDVWAAAGVGLFYALSGFFAGHASHIGIFQAAAWLPLILWSLHRAIVGGSRWLRDSLLTGIFAAAMFLAGHFQTALYVFFAMALYSVVLRRWVPAGKVLAVAAVATVLLTAVQWVPGLTLVRESIRASQQYTTATNSPLAPGTLTTLMIPNAFGAVKGPYTGPADVTQFYFYAGLALLPLAVYGALKNRAVLWAALTLLIPCLWYALGPLGGFYLVLSQLPGFRSVRAPVHIWFVVALALALLAGAGLERLKQPWWRYALLAFTFADLCYWNSYNNELPYLKSSYEAEYGQKLEQFSRAVSANLPPLTRFHTPIVSPFLGPLTGPLLTRTAVTYGYNPLELSAYDQYIEGAKTDAQRLNVLGAALQINPKTGQLERNPAAEPRFTLANGGTVQVLNAEQDRYRLRYQQAAAGGRLRIAIPYFPGWTAAQANGQPVAIERDQNALMAAALPAGAGELTLEFHLPGLAAGAGMSGVGLIAVVGLLLWTGRHRIAN